MSVTVSVLLVDDHAVVREGYRRLLERSGGISVIGEAAEAAQAYQQFCDLGPQVVVMDIYKKWQQNPPWAARPATGDDIIDVPSRDIEPHQTRLPPTDKKD